MSGFSFWRKLASGLTLAMLTLTLVPNVGIAAPVISLLSEASTQNNVYDLEIKATEVPDTGKVQYKKFISSAWSDMVVSSESTSLYSADNVVLAEGDNDVQVRVVDAAGSSLKEQTFTIAFDSNFTVTSSLNVSSSNEYTLYVTVGEVPFLGKAQYATGGGVFFLWNDLTGVAGNNYKAQGITLQTGDNQIYLRTINASGVMQTQQMFVVNYTPYGFTLVSDATTLTTPYTLKVGVAGFPPIGTKVQYQASSGGGALNPIVLWSDMELDSAGIYKKDLNSLNTGANKIKLRLLSTGNNTLYSGDVTVTLGESTPDTDDTPDTDQDTDTTDDDTEEDTNNDTDTTPKCVHKDLAANYEYCDAIEFNYELGTFTGDGNGNFRASDGVIRAEAAKILNVAQDIDLAEFTNDGNAGFSDAVSGQWYISYLKASKENGVITGYPNGTFLPGQVVIRAEFAAMIIRALGINVAGACDAQYASDIDKSTYWGESACYLVKNDLIDLENGKFDPLGAMTREDIARLIFAAKDLI